MLWPFVAFSAGSFLTTVEDMAKWDAALHSEALLKRAVERMWTPARANGGGPAAADYGFGLQGVAGRQSVLVFRATHEGRTRCPDLLVVNLLSALC